MTYAIDCRQLTKTWPGNPPVEAVRGIDLQVEQGTCFGVLGPNGAGKTTTIEICEGLQTATSGEAFVLGKSWANQANEIVRTSVSHFRKHVCPRSLRFLETLTLFRSFYQSGMDRPKRSHESHCRKISRSHQGIIRRATSASRRCTALIGNPKLLFLDEPTTGLDPQSRRELWKIISDFREAGGTVLLTTHYMDEAERLCDRVAIFDRGKILAIDSPQKLIADLGAEHVVMFSVGEDQSKNLPDDFGSTLPGVISARMESDMRCLSVREPHVAIPALLTLLNDKGLKLTSLNTRQATLEDVFVHYAGHGLNTSETGAAR